MRVWFKPSMLVAMLMVGMLLSSVAIAERWDMPVRSNQQNFMTQNIMQFADELEARTDGAIEIVLHPEDSLVRQPNVKRAIRAGQIPIGEWFVSLHSNQKPIFGIDSIPFLATSFEQNAKLLKAARPALEKALQSQGIKLLFVEPWPPQSFFSQKELSSVSDLKGDKFRAYNPITGRLAELMGAKPVTVQQAEVSQAFSTGVVDAMITSPATGVDSQAWDFAKYYTDVRAFIPWNIVAINQAVYDGLDEQTQDALLDASENAEERAWKLAPEKTDELIATLSQHGMEIRQPTDQMEEELETIGATLVDEWLDQAGQSGQKIIEEYRESE